ncbi:MAG: NADH-quinone oxidoreductase subunit C [Acidimicrobiia bacterium]
MAEAPTGAAPGTDEATDEATDEQRRALLDEFTAELGEAVLGHHIRPGLGLWVRVERDAWRSAVEAAKGRLGCTFFDFLSAIDWMPSPWGRYEYSALDDGMPRPDPDAAVTTGLAGGDTRFQVFCRVADVRRHRALVLKADLPGDDLRVESIVPVHAGAEWHERECWEMFGIAFDGHPGLRHLYLPGQFEGNPLRKDFPLLARLVKPWPGIVDVEPMPEQPEAGDNGAGDGGAGSESTPGGDS